MSDTLIELSRFGHDEAWRLGSALVERCRTEGLAVTITIRLGEQRVFHAALPGTSPDNDGWADQQGAASSRGWACARSTVFERQRARTIPESLPRLRLCRPHRLRAHSAERYRSRSRGALVGTLAVSGLESEEDRALAVDALRAEAVCQADGLQRAQ